MIIKKLNWYELEDPSGIHSPGLIFYEERIQGNINTLIEMIDDKSRLRPHVKTHKSAELTKLMLAAGINKYKCATISEAEMLGQCEAPDVLIAYQPVGPNIQRLILLQERFPQTRFSCLVDNLETATALALAAKQHQSKVAVYIDLNVGMNRTGTEPAQALTLYQGIQQIDELKLYGLHAYDGHIHDADYKIRQQKVREIITVLQDLLQQIEQIDHQKPIIIAGGTPGFPIYAAETDFECSPGTFALWDDGYQQAFQEQQFDPAALVISRIVSLPGEDLICTDLGHKAVAAENMLSKRIRFLNAPELLPISQSEEHLVLKVAKNHKYKIGDILYGLPYHICPTVALYDYAVNVQPGKPNQLWSISSRKRKDTI